MPKAKRIRLSSGNGHVSDGDLVTTSPPKRKMSQSSPLRQRGVSLSECDPMNPLLPVALEIPAPLPTFESISKAAYLIRDNIMRTPIHRAHDKLIAETKCELYFKKDYLLTTGSFKERGARNALKLLPDDVKKKGVIAASAGNHALALAYHGASLEVPVTVVMPLTAPLVKVSRCRDYGATVLLHGSHIGEAKDYAFELSAEKGLVYINGYDHPHIISGQGTIGLEIAEDMGDVDAVLLPIGGGGLAAGISLALRTLRPDIELIGIEPERCASYTAALKAGTPVVVDMKPTLADGLGVPKVGCNAFQICSKYVDKVVTVRESYIANAVLMIMEHASTIIEGGGAIGVAALLQGVLPHLKGKKVLSLLCGSNIDITVCFRVVDRGLAFQGRLVRFVAVVEDSPGGVAGVSQIIANHGASIKDVYHERAWIESDVFAVLVTYTVETRDRAHGEGLRLKLEESGTLLRWGAEDGVANASRITKSKSLNSI